MSTLVATPTRVSRMRTPDYATPGATGTPGIPGTGKRDAQHFENEYYQYLKPEAFTILPPEVEERQGGQRSERRQREPSPPKAPEPYKLTPRKRHKNQAFAIIAEPGLSAPNSRAGSPTGRVSPFRGRGFNPAGSRHASPAPSPPPGDDDILRHSQELTNQLRKSSIGRSQIPVLAIRSSTRRSSAEDVLSPETSPPDGLSPRRSNLQSQYSRSMINIAPRSLSRKPPPSPRRGTLKPSFVRLSPIIGSSPEAGSDQMSSPSRIPRSRSQPPSRIMSPNGTRLLSPPNSRQPSRPPSRGPSRDTSPGRSPSKIPMKSSAYKNIPAKVETFNRVVITSKPKVPQKPKVYSTRNSNLDRSSLRKPTSKSQIGSRSPRKELDDTETTDTDRDIRTTNRSVSRRGSIVKPSGSGYGKPNTRTKYDSQQPSTSRGYGKTTSDSYDRSSTTSTVAGGNYSSKTSVKKGDTRSENRGDNRNENRGDNRSDNRSDNRGDNRSDNRNDNRNGNRNDNRNDDRNDSNRDKGVRSRTNSQTFRKEDKGAKETRNRRNETSTDDLSKSDDETTEDAKDDDILSVTIDEIIGSQTTKIVSATAETVVKPLNIEAKLIKQSDVDNSNQKPGNTTTNSNQKPGNTTTTNVNSQKEGNNTNLGQNQTTTTTSGHPVTNTSSNNPVSTLPTPANGSVLNTPINNTSDQTNQTPSNNLSDNLSNNLKHVSNSLPPSVNSLEMNVKNNFNNLTPPDSDKVSSKSLMDSSPLTNSSRVKQARTVIVDEIKPIKITVREKSGEIEVQSGNMPRSATNGIAERPLLSPNNHPQSPDPPSDAPAKPGPCSKIFSCCKKQKPAPTTADGSQVSGVHSLASVAPNEAGAEAEKTPKCWDKLCCKKSGKVGDVNNKFSCFPNLKKGKDDENWADRRDSILSEPPKKTPFSQTLRKIFCAPCTKCKKKPDESVSRRTSMMSKKKSLSSTMQPPPEDTGPKLDPTLVEHASHMRGAIPVLPIPLAWVCLIFNVFLPGFGTILSGLFCLCIGKPRFSPRDSAKARFGAFLIDVIVGISQCFTVLFCLVGWGWSIWWGVIMLKVARKYRKIQIAEKNAIEEIEPATAPTVPAVNINNHAQRDVERGS